MEVKEVVRLEDGREILVNLSEQEHSYLLSLGINQAIAHGILALGEIDGDEVIGQARDNPELN